MAMIFQDSGSALDPIVRIGKQFRELFKSHIEISNEECDRRAIELLESVSLPNGADMLRRYPHELSGGQRQRVGIAMALALDPVLLIGDEPTSALDVTTQSQVVMQMLELSKQHNSAIVMVTHNLGVAAYMSDYIVVMKKGRVVDAGTPQDILENPSNEYTKQLKMRYQHWEEVVTLTNYAVELKMYINDSRFLLVVSSKHVRISILP